MDFDGQRLLTLAEGAYTFVLLAPSSGELTVESPTVVGPRNLMTKVSETERVRFPTDSPLRTLSERPTRLKMLV